MPALHDYIRIPNVSPAFDPQWARARPHGARRRADPRLVRGAADRRADRRACTSSPGRTPLIVMRGPRLRRRRRADDTVLLYGHLDKQPEMTGWRDGLGPWTPVVEGDRLYGRGGADDGYAAFAVAARDRGRAGQRAAPTPAASCSSRPARRAAAPTCRPTSTRSPTGIGTPSLVLCLDSGCLDYERLWVTTSLRGLVGGTLRVEILTRGRALRRGQRRRAVERSASAASCSTASRTASHRQDAAARAARRDPRRPASSRRGDTAAEFPIGRATSRSSPAPGR